MALDYSRRRPEATALYRVIQDNYRTLLASCEEAGRPLPAFVEREFEGYLRCGILAHGFARVRCQDCGYERLVAFSCRKRGWCPSCQGRLMAESAEHLTDHVLGKVAVRQWVLSLPPPLRYLLASDAPLCSEVLGVFVDSVFRWLRRKAKATLGLASVSLAHPGAVTVIQRASSHLALNIHFHTLATDGVFVAIDGRLEFRALPRPTDEEVAGVAQDACRRIVKLLEKRGRWGEAATEEDPLVLGNPGLAHLYATSIRGVLTIGPRAGRRLVRFVGVAATEGPTAHTPTPGILGFNLHARTSVGAGDREGLARLCRYVLRPPLAQERLRLLPGGTVRLEFKHPWSDGTRAIDYEPLDLVAKLAALVPTPRTHRIRFHGVFSAHAKLRPLAVPEPPEEEDPGPAATPSPDAEPASRSRRCSWAKLLAKVFAIDVLQCPLCESRLQRIAFILDSSAIRKILGSVGMPADSPVVSPPRSPSEEAAELPAA